MSTSGEYAQVKDDHPFEIKEINQSGKLIATYIHSHTTSNGEESDRIDVDIAKGPSTWVMSIVGAFMPVGYPDSVTDDYTAYQFYDSIQAFASTIAGLLASRAVLQVDTEIVVSDVKGYAITFRVFIATKTCSTSSQSGTRHYSSTYFYIWLGVRSNRLPGLGVGDSTASATGAVLLNVLQESAGRIATILFAHRLGSALEPECKKYRLMADIFNDAAMILDCVSPAFPKVPRVILLSVSSICKSLCGVAAGSSKASLSAHFAKQGNLAELNAKDASQETLISLLGMLVGTFVVSRISSQLATWTALIALLSVHLGTNYLAVRSVTMRTLNRQRANLVISSLISGVIKEEARYVGKPQHPTQHPEISLPSPKDVSLQELIFESDGAIRIQGAILAHCKVGVSLQEILSSISHPTISGSYQESKSKFSPGTSITMDLYNIFKKQGYIMWYDQRRNTFLVALKAYAPPIVQFDAWFHAVWAVTAMATATETATGTGRKSMMKMNSVEVRNWMEESLGAACAYRDRVDMYSLLRSKGWDLDTPAIEVWAGSRLAIPWGKGSEEEGNEEEEMERK
ncbi:hypothetical protein SBOR_2524 [Sclerotinia borealis F-4128]|uniref:Protein root UVB sensitive/RUS domain-containing protein n=1 Tax=Sclerotinia borealis (strain F-4128) TaxID=1432307 RepID=W9CR65_SCLBF|nr:hypothetical protein SBOR_2524 [Sclerotinia borealis F-4128]